MAEASQRFLAHVLTYLTHIISHYQSMTLDDLYNQLSLRLGFPFDYKLYSVPDFYQFALYYCVQVLNVQFVSGIFVASSKFAPFVMEQPTHRTTYSQEQPPTYYSHYPPPAEYSRTTQKKISQLHPGETGNPVSIRVPETAN